MSKKKGHEEAHMDETWLIPYADILTLLLALFIVLFCSSSIDVQKYNSLMQSFSREFNMEGAGNFDPNAVSDILTPPRASEGEDDQLGNTEDNKQMDELHAILEEYIEGKGLTDKMNVEILGESLLLTMTSDIWFPSGSAMITPGQRATAKQLADMIENSQVNNKPLNIIITGHTDNVPINTYQFPSNWYLSATRAINFMEAMLAQSNLDPRMFSARGYGEYDPIATNLTSEGRQLNRRVEMLISLSGYVPPRDSLNTGDTGNSESNTGNVIQVF